jgi:hypothetical protein
MSTMHQLESIVPSLSSPLLSFTTPHYPSTVPRSISYMSAIVPSMLRQMPIIARRTPTWNTPISGLLETILRLAVGNARSA